MSKKEKQQEQPRPVFPPYKKCGGKAHRFACEDSAAVRERPKGNERRCLF